MLFKMTLSVWHNQLWLDSFRKGWKRPAYWVRGFRPDSVRGGAIALQVGDLTFKLTWESKHG